MDYTSDYLLSIHAHLTILGGNFQEKFLLFFVLILVPLKFQNISRLAVQDVADRIEGGEANRADFACFYFGEVYVGYPHLLGQLLERHFTVRHHTVQS